MFANVTGQSYWQELKSWSIIIPKFWKAPKHNLTSLINF